MEGCSTRWNVKGIESQARAHPPTVQLPESRSSSGGSAPWVGSVVLRRCLWQDRRRTRGAAARGLRRTALRAVAGDWKDSRRSVRRRGIVRRSRAMDRRARGPHLRRHSSLLARIVLNQVTTVCDANSSVDRAPSSGSLPAHNFVFLSRSSRELCSIKCHRSGARTSSRRR
jgi:hypothetical protein